MCPHWKINVHINYIHKLKKKAKFTVCPHNITNIEHEIVIEINAFRQCHQFSVSYGVFLINVKIHIFNILQILISHIIYNNYYGIYK